jgi:serine/threonine protein kinase
VAPGGGIGHPAPAVWEGSADATELLLGKYQIVQPIKTGGTAAIYLALLHGENQFTREVVIKRPLPHLLADERLRSMFVDEAFVQARLSHPNIVQVIDLVSKGSEVYLVLEYLSGRDLREILIRLAERDERMPLDVALHIGAEIAAGLDYAHDATGVDGSPLNLVHRDISPKNVRITDRGAVKVIDFGIARFDNRRTETRQGAVKGTLGYMSPEQIMGEELDRRSDVFAFGICLFQMFTGQNPFHGATLKERIERLIHAPIPNVCDLVPELPEGVGRVVARCLERDVEARTGSCGEVQRALLDLLHEQRIVSPRERLVGLLESLFPDIHEPPPRLREALTAVGTGALRAQPVVNSSLGTDLGHADRGAVEVEPPSVALPRTVTDARIGREAVAARGRRDRGLLFGMIGVVAALSVATAWTVWRGPGPGPGVEVAAVVADAGAATVDVGSDVGSAVGSAGVAPASATGPDAGAAAAAEALDAGPAVAAAVDAGVGTGGGRRPPDPRRSSSRARDLLRAGVMLAREGRSDDALMLYHLAWAASGRRPDPGLIRNLAVVHQQRDEGPKMRACFEAYLARRPDASDAARIRALLAAYPATADVACVDAGQLALAARMERRLGARIEGWIEAAGR